MQYARQNAYILHTHILHTCKHFCIAHILYMCSYFAYMQKHVQHFCKGALPSPTWSQSCILHFIIAQHTLFWDGSTIQIVVVWKILKFDIYFYRLTFAMYEYFQIRAHVFPDFGASVIRVDKLNQPPMDTLARYV